jgi:hypothetical protein
VASAVLKKETLVVESMNRTVKTCCWVKSKPGEQPVEYCGKPTRWHWSEDEDGQRYHNYDIFCTEHRLVTDMESDRQKLFLERILDIARRHDINPAEIGPEDQDLDELPADELELIYRSMWEMDK